MRERSVYLSGAALRAALLVGGALQDSVGRIRYTDIDYDVFSDAARLMAAGGSPVSLSAQQLLLHAEHCAPVQPQDLPLPAGASRLAAAQRVAAPSVVGPLPLRELSVRD